MKILKINVTAFLLILFSTCWSVSPIEFQRAVLNGETHIVKEGLKEKGYEYIQLLDKDHNTPLHLAACAKKGGPKADIIALLLKYGADSHATNRYFSTPLYIAVSTNNLEGANLLLKEGGDDINLVSASNMTPLIAAITNRSAEMIQLLLSHPQTDPNQENTDGLTPLHLTAKWGYAKEAALVLNDPRTHPSPLQSQGDFAGATPLHYAAMQAHPEMIKLLLKQKITNVNMTIGVGLYEGFTPIHCAVMNPNTPQVFECLKLLVNAGGRVNLKTKNGKLPSDLTSVRVILQFLADPDPSYELKKKTRSAS